MAKTYSCILVGLDVVTVEIECVIGAGFSGLHILGLKSDIARDMRERIRSALEFIGIPIPAKRVVVNLSAYELFRLARSPLQELDFAVSAAVIIALFEDQKIILPTRPKEFFASELTLTAQLKPVSNQLIYQKVLYDEKFEGHFSIGHCSSTTIRNDFDCYDNLLNWMLERKQKSKVAQNIHLNLERNYSFSKEETKKLIFEIVEMSFQPKICVAILVAAVGHHHLLLAGEPGIGKTYNANKIINFLKPLTVLESIELQLIYSQQKRKKHCRPLRSPHHSSTVAALIGGQTLKPGEATLAHHGVLFLDEISEFSRSSLDALREPLDSGSIELARSAGTIEYPAQFLLCATTNPCPCGYLFSRTTPCRCLPHISKNYLSKLSGPLLDRFDMKIWIENPHASNNQQQDIFSNYIKNLSKSEIIEFAKNFIQIQIENLQPDPKFKIAEDYTSDMKDKMSHDSIKCVQEKFSLRGQQQFTRLQQTFKKIFPTLTNEKSFMTDILAYRNFTKILENDLIG